MKLSIIRSGLGLLGVLAAVTAASPAFAVASIGGAKIENITTRTSNFAWVRFDRLFDTMSSVCVQTNMMVIPLNTDAGKAMLSQVTAAFLAGKTVYAEGTAGAASTACVSGHVDGTAERMGSLIVVHQ